MSGPSRVTTVHEYCLPHFHGNLLAFMVFKGACACRGYDVADRAHLSYFPSFHLPHAEPFQVVLQRQNVPLALKLSDIDPA